MRHVAVDFGAGSGRVIVGEVLPERTKLEEVHRFPNRQVRMGDRLYWEKSFPAISRYCEYRSGHLGSGFWVD